MYRQKFMDVVNRAQVATIALEDDLSHMGEPMQADPLVSAPIEPMFNDDDADSVEQKVIATNEAAKELEVVLEDIENAITVSQEIREISEIVSNSKPEDVSPATIAVMNFAVESACLRIGFKAPPLPSMEAYAEDNTGTVTVALESFQKRLAAIMEAVINGIKRAVAAAKQWYERLFDTTRVIKGKSQALLSMTKEITSREPNSDTLPSSNFATDLAIGNSLPQDIVREAQVFDQFLSGFLSSITKVTSEGYQELLRSLNDTSSDNRTYVKSLMRAMEATDSNGGAFRFANGEDDENEHRSPVLLGNRVFVIKTAKVQSEEPHALIQALSFAGFEVQRERVDVIEVRTLTPDQISKISQIAHGMSNNIAKFKALSDQLEKSKTAMASAVSNLRNRFSNEDDKSWNWVASFVEQSLLFTNKMFDAPPRIVLDNATVVANALLAYADRSLRQYDRQQKQTQKPSGVPAEEAVAAA